MSRTPQGVFGWFHRGLSPSLVRRVSFRKVGPPPGADARYYAWFKQWGLAWKFVGWLWVVTTGTLQVIAVVALGGRTS